MLEPTRVFGAASLVGAPIDGLRKFGVPPGGAYDRESLALANALLGNPPTERAWEVVGVAEFELSDGVAVAAVGGRLVRSGSTVRLAVKPPAYRAYLAFRAGRSPVRRLSDPPESVSNGPIRVLAGPQADLLPGLLDAEYAVSIQSDRVGLRLDGPRQPHAVEMTSEPACFGAIQIANGGQPIILGPDGPTLGGYPKVAVVVRADLDRLGQLAPGKKVRFERVTVDDAEALWSERAARLERRLRQLALAVGPAG